MNTETATTPNTSSNATVEYLMKAFREMPLEVARDLLKVMHGRSHADFTRTPEEAALWRDILRRAVEAAENAVNEAGPGFTLGENPDDNYDYIEEMIVKTLERWTY